MPILIGNEKNYVECEIFTDANYPKIAVEYRSELSEINNLKYLGVKLSVDGKEIEADSEEYEATAKTLEEKSIKLAEKDCCANLAKKLKLDIPGLENRYAYQFDEFKIEIRKDFKSLNKLPEKMIVILTATTDKGTTEMERTVFLTSEYRYDFPFIRFH